MQHLGALRSTHPTANGPRWILSLGLLAIAAAAGGGLAWLISNPGAGRGFGAVMTYAMIPIVVALPIALVQLVFALRIGETFEVYEQGLARTVRGRRREWTWDQVAEVEFREKDHSPRFGWDFRCTLVFRDGKRLTFNGLTHDARTLAAVLKENHQHAYVDTWVERMEDVLPWLPPVGLAGFGWLIWWCIDTLNTNGDQSDRLSPEYVEGVRAFSDSAIAGFAALTIFGIAGFVVSAIFTWVFTVDHLWG